MLRKILVVGTVITAIAAFAVVSQPVQARSCYAVLAKGRGLDEATASARSLTLFVRGLGYVCSGSKADMTGLICDVCFTPESRHQAFMSTRPN